MNYANIEIALMALIPSFLLCNYIFRKDKKEKEPPMLLLLLFVAGVVCYIPAILCENALMGIFRELMSDYLITTVDGSVNYTTVFAATGHGILNTFVAVAIVEEIAKWTALFLITSKNKNFNCLFDGVVYSVFVSLGFATAENIRYALVGGWDTLVMRLITSLPGHIFFGVVMGYFYTMWHSYNMAVKSEKKLGEKNIVAVFSPFTSGKCFVLTIVAPILLHGFYSFAGSYSTTLMTALFYITVGVFYVVCFMSIRRLSLADTEKHKIVSDMLIKKYPGIKARVEDLVAFIEE